MSSREIWARFNASLITGSIRSRWALLAISGTTPPHFLCRSTCEEITLDLILLFSMTAAEVSSHEVSIARICIQGIVVQKCLIGKLEGKSLKRFELLLGAVIL